MKYLQWARRSGEVVHVSQVESGAACGCICDKCELALVAKKGPLRAHHFAHTNADCDGNQETLIHKMAKEAIARTRRLKLESKSGYEEFSFDRVEVEQPVGPFRADLIGFKNAKQCIIEIAVTHRCDHEKVRYFKQNGLAAVEIAVDAERAFKTMDEFSDYVIAGASRSWISNPKLQRMLNAEVAPVYDAHMSEAQKRRLQEDSEFLDLLRRSAGSRAHGLHYGSLVEEDLQRFGIWRTKAICVRSGDLPSEYGNLGIVLWDDLWMRKYVGRRVGFRINHPEDPRPGRSDILFPEVGLWWVEDVGKMQLLAEMGHRRWNRNHCDWI